LASRQGFGELKTEQLGGHLQEQQRHRQAPIDDFATIWMPAVVKVGGQCIAPPSDLLLIQRLLETAGA